MRGRTVHRFPTCLLAALLAVAGSGCVTTQLEFDRMTGTAYPTDQTLGGKSWNLTRIYFQGGHLLAVDEDDTNIAQVTDGFGNPKNCISNAELDSLMAANRQTQVGAASFACGFNRRYTCTRHHVYGIVANHLGISGGSCSSTLLGRMWDSTDRSAFAVFYKNSTISGDGKKYLRTTAHEIGHAFNLHHGDGDGSQTLMNQTSVVGNNFTYEFSANSETHLRDHPDGCRFPGSGSFTSVNGDHDGWHSGVSSGCS